MTPQRLPFVLAFPANCVSIMIGKDGICYSKLSYLKGEIMALRDGEGGLRSEGGGRRCRRSAASERRSQRGILRLFVWRAGAARRGRCDGATARVPPSTSANTNTNRAARRSPSDLLRREVLEKRERRRAVALDLWQRRWKGGEVEGWRGGEVERTDW